MDYTDSQRVNNVQLAKNVKIVEPNSTIIYACPVILEGAKRISPVFVTPKVLNVGEGDIVQSSSGWDHAQNSHRIHGWYALTCIA